MPRHRLSLAALATCGALWLAMPAHADEASNTKASASLVKAYVSLCIQSMSNLDQVETSAASRGWKKLDGSDGTRFAAPSPTATSTAWTVQDAADVPFYLVITHGTQPRKKISVCTIVNAAEPAKEVRPALVKMLDLQYPIQNEERDDQQATYWNKMFEGNWIVVSLSAPADTTRNGVTISATLIQNAP